MHEVFRMHAARVFLRIGRPLHHMYFTSPIGFPPLHPDGACLTPWTALAGTLTAIMTIGEGQHKERSRLQ